METIESDEVIEELSSPTSSSDAVTSISSVIEEVGSLEVAFLYDAPMREMTV